MAGKITTSIILIVTQIAVLCTCGAILYLSFVGIDKYAQEAQEAQEAHESATAIPTEEGAALLPVETETEAADPYAAYTELAPGMRRTHIWPDGQCCFFEREGAWFFDWIEMDLEINGDEDHTVRYGGTYITGPIQIPGCRECEYRLGEP